MPTPTPAPKTNGKSRRITPRTDSPDTASFHVTNAKPDELRFLGGLFAIFCDPARAAQAAALKAGTAQIAWSAGNAVVRFDNH